MSLFSKKAYVGLDIGHHTLRAVQVERTTSGWRVAKSASAPTPEDTVRDGVVIDPTILGLAIKNLMKGAHINATSASIAISGGTVVVRPIRLPKMAESALRKSIRFEASRYVPNSVEDSYIEFEIIGDVDATNMDVIIAAAPKELVDSRVAACEQAGLEVENVEIATFAAYRSIIEADHGHDWADKTVGLVDIGAAVTNLGVINNGGFSMTRAIPAGGQVLTEALKSYFKLSTEDAENGKAQLDIRGLLSEASVAENPPLRILHTHVDDLVREVRRSINYWQSQQNEAATAKHVDVIVLCGGGSNLPGLPEYFQHKLGIETFALGVFDNPRFLPSHSDEGHGLDMAVAVGLAMGLAPHQAVVREPKSEPVKAVKNVKPPKPPKDPKPPKTPKPSKGRTFKVTKPVEAPVATEEAVETTEGVEIAATLHPEPIEIATPEAIPTIAAEGSDEHEWSAPPVIAIEEEPMVDPLSEVVIPAEQVDTPAPHGFDPTAEETPGIEADVESKYGPELAALIGTLEDSPGNESATEAKPDLTAASGMPDEIAQPYSASQRMASRGKSAPLPTSGLDHEGTDGGNEHVGETTAFAEATDATSGASAEFRDLAAEGATTHSSEATAAETTQTPAASVDFGSSTGAPDAAEHETPAAKSAAEASSLEDIEEHTSKSKSDDESALRAALLSDPVGSTLGDAAPAVTPKKEKKGLFSIGKKPTNDLSLTVKTGKPVKLAKADKPPKPAKAPKHASPVAEAEGASSLKKAASWLFGAPKQHEKPSGILKSPTDPSEVNVNSAATASGNKEIELLRGTSLEPVTPSPEAHTAPTADTEHDSHDFTQPQTKNLETSSEEEAA